MRASIRSVLVCLALTASSPSWATASFANRELGAGVGVFFLQPPDDARVPWGLPLTLEGGVYMSNGFDAYLKLQFMLLRQTIGEYVFGFGGHFGVRYLFLEETIRPYVMLHLAGFGMPFRAQGPNFFVGPGTGAGIDFFVSDSISLGLRATVDLFFTIVTDIKVQASLGGAGYFTTYF